MAAVLFKVEFAWKNGLTNPACTAKECGWSAFGAKHRVEPQRIKEMNWHKPHFSKRGIKLFYVSSRFSNPKIMSMDLIFKKMENVSLNCETLN